MFLTLPGASNNAIAVGLPTVEDLKDLFTDSVGDKANVEKTLRLIVDNGVAVDICCIMFIFDWFLANIVDPNFAWTSFTRAVYLAEKRARTVVKASMTSTPAVAIIASISSSIDFSADVLLADSKHQARPPTPGTTGTLKPHKLCKLPFATSSHSTDNIRQLHNTDLVMASSKPLDVIEFYRKLVSATKSQQTSMRKTTLADWWQILQHQQDKCDTYQYATTHYKIGQNAISSH
jgi:hypothetical protein